MKAVDWPDVAYPPAADVAPEPALARVLHVTESAFGGVGSYLNQILPALPHAMRLVIPETDRLMVPDVPPGQIVGYRREGRSLRSLARLARTVLATGRHWRPDVVHLHSTFAGLVLRPLLVVTRRVWGWPDHVVYTAHGWAFDITGSPGRARMVAWVERMLAHVTDRIVTLSRRETETCLAYGFPPEKLVLIYNGIADRPPAPPAPWPDARRKVLFVGRFDRQKGLDVLFEALRPHQDTLVARCVGASVVGGGMPADLPPNVELIGWQSAAEIGALMAACDLVVMPSRWEGFGLVAVEAMRAARMIVASNVGGLPEVVADGVTGRIIPAEDATALAEAMLADDAATRAAMGRAGRARFEALFTRERSAAAVSEIYAALRASHP